MILKSCEQYLLMDVEKFAPSTTILLHLFVGILIIKQNRTWIILKKKRLKYELQNVSYHYGSSFEKTYKFFLKILHRFSCE